MFVAWKCPAMCRGAPVLGYTVEYAEAKAASGVASRSSKQAPAWRHAYTGDILSCMVRVLSTELVHPRPRRK